MGKFPVCGARVSADPEQATPTHQKAGARETCSGAGMPAVS